MVKQNKQKLCSICCYRSFWVAINSYQREKPYFLEVVAQKLQVQGLRSPKMGSLLNVNDQFLDKCNAAIGVFVQPLLTLM